MRRIEKGENETEELKLRNPPTEDDMENLIDLLHLNEPEILFYLEKRYDKNIIYTYTGKIDLKLPLSSW